MYCCKKLELCLFDSVKIIENVFSHTFNHMIPFFFLSVALNPYRNITVAVGAVSTNKNPFWSQKLPGINYCDNEKYIFNFEKNHNERKTILPFPNTLHNETDTIEFTHEQCTHIVKEKFINIFNKLAIEGAFLRFYIGQTVIRTNFFTTSNDGNKKIYTHYLIYIDNTENTESPRAKVIPSEDTSLILKQDITFSFAVKFTRIESNEEQLELKSQKDKQLDFLITASIVFFIISVIISLVFYFKKKDTHDVPLGEIWRIPPDLGNSFLFIIFGMYIMNIFFYLLLLKRDCDPYGAYVEKIIYPSLVIPITLFTLIAKTVGLKPSLQNWMSPSLVYFVVYILIPHIYTVFFGIFGSFRGFSIIYIVLSDPFFLLMNLIFIDGVGPSANLLNPLRVVDFTTGPSPLQIKSVKFISKIFDLVYVGLSAVILMPITQHIFEIFFDDALVNEKLFGAIFVLFCSIGSIFALIRALPRTLYLTESWQSGMAPLNFNLAILEVLYVIYIAIFERHVIDIQAILMIVVFTIPYFFTILGVGSAVFYLVPFVPILATFSQPKST